MFDFVINSIVCADSDRMIRLKMFMRSKESNLLLFINNGKPYFIQPRIQERTYR